MSGGLEGGISAAPSSEPSSAAAASSSAGPAQHEQQQQQEEEEEEKIDLALLLACLSRDELEILLAQAIARQPPLYDRLLALCRQPLDVAAFSSSLTALLDGASSPSSFTPALEAHLHTAADYVKVGNTGKALQLLEAVTEAACRWCSRHRGWSDADDAGDDEQQQFDAFIALMETGWEDCLNATEVEDAVSPPQPSPPRPLLAGANRLPCAELMLIATKLGRWQQRLKEAIGSPALSDPLRVLRRKLRRDMGGPEEREAKQRPDDAAAERQQPPKKVKR